MMPEKEPSPPVSAGAVHDGNSSAQKSRTFTSYGLRFSISCDSEVLLDAITVWLPPGTQSAGDPAAAEIAEPLPERVFSIRAMPDPAIPFKLYGGRSAVADAANETELLLQIESAVGIFVAENAPRHVFIHAGCVVWKDRAIVIPGHCRSGKTNLVSAFLRAGATYYSDEYSVLDPDGMVLPYPRRLSFRSAGGRLKTSAGELGASTGTAPVAAGRLIFTAFEADAPWQPQRLTPGESVMKLLDNTPCARRSPSLALPVLVKLAESTEGFFSLRGDADRCVAEILSSL